MSLPVEVHTDAAVRAGLLARSFAALLGEVLVWDAEARLVFASAVALRRIGLPADIDLAGRTCPELPVTPTLQAGLHEAVQAALTTGRALTRDLSEHLSLRSMPLADEGAAPWAVVLWLRPVVTTDRLPPGERPPPAPWEDGDGLVAAFRENFEMADFASSLLDSEGRFRAMNLASGATMGQDPAAMIGRRVDECFTAEVADMYRQRLDRVLQTRRPLVCEDHMITAQRESWYLSVLVPIYNPRGRIIGIQTMSHDITGMRREAARARLDAVIVEASRGLVGREPAAIDRAVDDTLAQVAAVLGADSAALLQVDSEGTVAATHRRGGDAEERLRLPLAPLQALVRATREPLLVLQDLGLTGAPAALGGALAGDPRSLVFVPVQARGALLGGLLLRWFHAPTHSTPQVLASLPVLADLLLAVLRRKRAEEALQHSEASLRRSQALARIGSYSYDLRGGPTHWSEETLRIAGVAPGSALPTLDECIDHHVHPDEREVLRGEYAHLIAFGGELARELRILLGDGSVREVQIVAEAQRDADGAVAQIHGTILDISERRRLEAQLLHAQKMEAIGRLAGGVAHDFNNLLTVILGGTAALQLELPPGPLTELVAEIDDAGRRATALTRQLLAFSRRQVLAPTELDLGRVVRESLRVLARVIGEDIKLELSLVGEALPVVADPSQIEQVLLNLVVNAREAMPAGGRLTIGTALLPRLRADAGGGPWALLMVRDTGCGVDPEVKAKMFEPFFTTKPRGQGGGLGLSTVHAVVDGLGGRIEVDSVVGVGTELRVFLPSRRAPEPVLPVAPPRASELRGHETVLVVEDEDGVRNLVKRVLDLQGYRVLTARDATEAQHICGEVAVDLVLTDVVMPGLSGHALAQRLRARRPTRVLFMSGYDPEETDPGSGELLRKPFAPQELISRVRAALDLPVPQDMSQAPG